MLAKSAGSLRSVISNPLSGFLFRFLTLYLIWYFSYEFYFQGNSGLDRLIIHSLVVLAGIFLKVLGYSLVEFGDVSAFDHLAIEQSSGVTVGAPCNGLVLFALFAIFIIAYPSKTAHKFWFIPLGILIIHLLNALRVAGLAVLVKMNPDWLGFNHDFTFTVIVYSVVFGLWYWWIKKFSRSTASNGQGS